MQRSNTRSFSFLWCYSIALLLLSGATACLQGTQYKLTSGVTENGEVSSSDNNARAFACVMINSDVNETSKASAFSVVVDRFSRIHLQGSYNAAVAGVGLYSQPEHVVTNAVRQAYEAEKPLSAGVNDTVVSVSISVHGVASPLSRHYLVTSVDGKRSVSNVMTAVVTVSEGVVSSVMWDLGTSMNACWFCGGKTNSNCKHNAYTTGIPPTLPVTKLNGADYGYDCMDEATQCLPTEGGGNTCDLQIFVTWQGTAADGQSLTSASRRLSRFVSYNILSMKNSAIAQFNKFTDFLNKAISG